MSEQCTWFNLGFDSQFFFAYQNYTEMCWKNLYEVKFYKIIPWRNLFNVFKLQNTSNVVKFQVHKVFKYDFKITMVPLRAQWNKHPDFVKAQVGKSKNQISNEI